MICRAWLVVLMATVSAYAQAMADPIDVGDRACLFLDDRFIAEQSGFARTWHPGRPHDRVAIKYENDWEKWPHLYGSVFHDPADGKYKMYYTATNHPSINPPSSFTSYICYAESTDGKTWIKPKLNLHEHKGSRENNIVIKYGELPNVFIDPRAANPDERLKMFVYLMHQNVHAPGSASGESLLASGDGLRWKYLGPYNKPGYADPAVAEYTDSHFFMYDGLKDRYLSYVRTWAKSGPIAERKDGRRRAVGISQSQEINREWTPIVHVLDSDEHDDAAAAARSKDADKPDWAELYCLHFFDYGNHYLGPLSVFRILDGRDTGGGGSLQLTFSHDGLRWHRPPPPRHELLAPSSAAPQLFPTYATTNAPLEIGDELWLYYTEANGAHPLSPDFSKSISQIRAAIFRRDGFVSLDAPDRATLTTHPIVFGGKRLVLNLHTKSEGGVRVSLLDSSAQPLAGFALDDCDMLSGDHVRGVVSWRGKSDLSSLRDQPVVVHIELSRGSLYSFRFTND